MAHVFVTGGTGYVGSRLVPRLLSRGHRVAALARPGSESRLYPGAQPVLGDALDASTFASYIAPADTFVQLVGVPHPSPAKVALFRSIDLVSARASAAAAASAGVRHFVYVSVAHPAPVMKAYQETRAEAEAEIRARDLLATFLRPWYVLGPGHRWAHALRPVYWVAERIPSTREGALRCGLVTLEEMLVALVYAVEHTPAATRVIEVPGIRALARA